MLRQMLGLFGNYRLSARDTFLPVHGFAGLLISRVNCLPAFSASIHLRPLDRPSILWPGFGLSVLGRPLLHRDVCPSFSSAVQLAECRLRLFGCPSRIKDNSHS